MLDILIEAAINYVLPGVGVIVSGLVIKLIHKAEKKVGIDLAKSKEDLIAGVFSKGVLAISEEAASIYKDTNSKLSKNEKFNRVYNAGLDEIKKILPKEKITREDAKKYIHSALASINGEGATGKDVFTSLFR